jgi:hypothetical protein
MPDSGEAARRIAEAHSTGAVVWVSVADGGSALWIYDAAEDRIAARALAAEPPYDDATAAAVALSIKTLLRHSRVAPEPERWAAAAEGFGDDLPPPPSARAAPVDAPDTTADEPAAPPPAPAPRADPAGRLFLRVALDGRFRRTVPSAPEPRFSLGVLIRPFDGELLGVALDVASGPGVATDGRRFEGRLIDNEAMLSAVLRAPLAPHVGAAAEAGAGVQLTLLDGTLLENAIPAAPRSASASAAARRGFPDANATSSTATRSSACGASRWTSR